MINPIYKKKKEIEQLEASIKNLYRQNKYKLCIQECEKLANVFLQKNELVYLYLGKSYMNLGNYEKSKQSFLYCLTINELNMECYINLGTICSQLNEYEDALTYFDKYQQLVESDNESKDYTKRKISYLYNISNTYYMQKDIEKAQENVNTLLEIEPQNKSAILLLGDIFYYEQQYEKAEEQYFQAFKLDPNGISASYKLGMVDWKLEKYSEAIGQFELCLSINKKFVDAYGAIARILYKHLEKYEEAIFNFNQYISYNQVNELLNVIAYLEMGEIYEILFKSKEAIECYKKAFQINQNDSTSLLKIATILYDKRQDYKAASEYYEKIIRIKPSCSCHFQLQKYDKFIQVYKNLLLLDPYNSEVFQEIALCYQELKNYKESDIYFRLSLQINPYDINVKEQYAKLKATIAIQEQQQ